MIDYSYEFTFPAETTAPILVGEPPEPSGDDTADVPDPPAEQDLPPTPDPAAAMGFLDVEYELEGDSVEAQISLDSGETYFEFPGPVQVAWNDGVVTDTVPTITDGVIEVTTERSEPPLDAEVTEIRFEQLVHSLGRDEDATFHEDRIETEWGDFPIIDIMDHERVTYQPAGERWLRGTVIHHGGGRISISSSGVSFDEDFVPSDTHLEFRDDLEPVMDDLPLPVETEVWSAAADISIRIP